MLSDMIKDGSIKASRNLDAIAEMQKELTEHKNYVERMTNNKDIPFMEPVKAVVNEQITTMYSFMSEIKAESKAQVARNNELEQMLHLLESRVKTLQSEKLIAEEELKKKKRSLSPLQ